MKLTDYFRRELEAWTAKTGKTQYDFSLLLGKGKHWSNKVLSGGWHIHAGDIPMICAILGNENLIEAQKREARAIVNRIEMEAAKLSRSKAISILAEMKVNA